MPFTKLFFAMRQNIFEREAKRQTQETKMQCFWHLTDENGETLGLFTDLTVISVTFHNTYANTLRKVRMERLSAVRVVYYLDALGEPGTEVHAQADLLPLLEAPTHL